MNSSDEDIVLQVPTMTAFEFETTTMVTAKTFDLKGADESDELRVATVGILGTIFVIFGTVGNILSILVWTRRSMRSTTGTYLIALAVADLGHLWFSFLSEGIQIIHPAITRIYEYGVFYSYLGFPINMVFVTCSIWITVVLTADRCIKVRWKNLAQTMCSQKRALMNLGIIVFLCFCINIPHFMVYEPVTNSYRNETVVMFTSTAFGSSAGRQNYEFWVQCMILILVPVVCVFIFNMLIIHEVRTINRQIGSRKGSVGKEKGQKKEAQLTRLLLTVTFTFLIFNSFHCIVQCFVMLEWGDKKIVTTVNKVAKLAEVINSSVNFWLYCVSGKRFRKSLLKTVCGRYMKTQKGKTTTGTATTTTTTTATARTAAADSMVPINKLAKAGDRTRLYRI